MASLLKKLQRKHVEEVRPTREELADSSNSDEEGSKEEKRDNSSSNEAASEAED